MATSKDVAELAGVSHATVSRVFASPDKVSEKMVEKVYKAARALNYVPNSLASGLKHKNPKNVGLIISNIKNSFFTRVAYNIQKSLSEKKTNLLIGFSNEDIEVEKECISLHLSYRTSTILFTPSVYDIELERLIKLSSNVRFIQLFRNCYENVDSIVVDDRKGTEMITNLFLEKGHKKILLLDGKSNMLTYRDFGYADAFNKRNLEVDSRYLVQLSLIEDNQEVIKSLITELKPTGIIAVSEILSAQVVEVIHSLGLKIGEDIGVAAYDDSYIAKTLNLTAIGHDEEKIKMLINSCLQEIVFSNSSEHFHIKTEPILIERTSIQTVK